MGSRVAAGTGLASWWSLPIPASPLAVVLVGFGTVGQAVARRLVDRRPPELRLACVCTRTVSRTEVGWLPPCVRRTNHLESALASDCDIVIELIGGLEPAAALIRGALEAGKSVVTANKQLIAHQGGSLLALARRAGRQLRFEAAVGGGIPIVRAIQDGLAGDHLQRIIGVLNGTCTYVLSRMEDDRVSYEHALGEAQALGLAEADPSADVDGLDARAKLSILAAIAFHRLVSPSAIRAESIVALNPFDFEVANRLGCAIRQLAWAERNGNSSPLTAGVGPALVTRSSPLAQARGAQNAVLVTGRNGGSTLLAGIGAGRDATAVAVLSDLLSIARNPGAPSGDWPPPDGETSTSDLPTRFYLRAPTGSGRTITRGLATAGLSHEAVASPDGGCGRGVFDAWIVESCARSRLNEAIDGGDLDTRSRASLIALPYFTQAHLDAPDRHVQPPEGADAPASVSEGVPHA